MVDAAIQARALPSAPKRARQRAARRLRSQRHVVQPVPESLRLYDPLLRPKRPPSVLIILAGLGLGVAAALHVVLLVLFYAAGAVFQSGSNMTMDNIPIEVAIVEPPPPPEPEPPKPEPEPEPEKAEKPKPKPKPKKVEPPPPADPIDLKEKPKDEPKKPVRRIIGLSLESTVGGGGGPAFAVGNTRMGKTAKVAEKPQEIAPLSKEPPKKVKKPTTNRRARRIPTGGPKLVKPKRRKLVKPKYPEMYREANIETNVVVQVTISKTGKVVAVEIISPSRFPEFNEAAKAAAMQEEFEPARKGETAIEFTLSFTYRFRLSS